MMKLTRLPALSVVKIMVFNRQVCTEQRQEVCRETWRRTGDAQTAVSNGLGEDDILVTQPPIVECHWQTHQLQCTEREQRHECNLNHFLLGICIRR